MRITIVTNESGNIVASVAGHVSEHRKQPGPFATLRAGPGQLLHEIEVPDDYQNLAPEALHRALNKHIPKSQDSG